MAQVEDTIHEQFFSARGIRKPHLEASLPSGVERLGNGNEPYRAASERSRGEVFRKFEGRPAVAALFLGVLAKEHVLHAAAGLKEGVSSDRVILLHCHTTTGTLLLRYRLSKGHRASPPCDLWGVFPERTRD